MKVYIGADLFKDRGYFVRVNEENGYSSLINAKTLQKEYRLKPDDDKYYFNLNQLIDFIQLNHIPQLEISKSIPKQFRDIIAGECNGWIYSNEPNVIYNFPEPAKDSFDLGGAL